MRNFLVSLFLNDIQSQFYAPLPFGALLQYKAVQILRSHWTSELKHFFKSDQQFRFNCLIKQDLIFQTVQRDLTL